MFTRSKHEDALPLIVTHGWPGSVIEQLKIVEPLTNPTAHGAKASDAFHLVIPSIPRYGYSGKPTTTGLGPDRIARAWVELMRRLGYWQFAAQGGDWGAIVTDLMAVQKPPGLLGIHSNMPGVDPPDIDAALFAGNPLPSDLSADEKRACQAGLRIQAHRLRPNYGGPPAGADRISGFAGRSGSFSA
jgi:pimeloyl-ACP methyl ester carboxylesterase